jgi:hypothetical protein
MRWLMTALVSLPLVVVGWAGCATAGVADDLGDEAGTGGGDDSGDVPADDAGTDTSTSSYDADPGPGFDAAPVDSAPGPGEGGTTSCTSPNTCQAANDIGSVSGDTSSPAKSTTGITSEWIMVKITEDDSGVVGRKLNAHVSLTSPPGANFDLFLYVDTGGSPTSRACTTVSASSTNPTGADTASLNWGEGTIPNGSDDTRIVSVEVRWISGTCSPGSKWTLTVSGN